MKVSGLGFLGSGLKVEHLGLKFWDCMISRSVLPGSWEHLVQGSGLWSLRVCWDLRFEVYDSSLDFSSAGPSI